MPQRQNPSEFSHTLECQMGYSSDNLKPFSIRKYVSAARLKDISHNWPFPEEYLQVCVKHGISRVLPPFEHHESVRNPSCREDVGSADVASLHKHCPGTVKEEGFVKVESAAYINEEISEVTERVCLLSLSANRYENGEDNDLNSNIVRHPMTSSSKVHISDTKLNLNCQQDLDHATPGSTNRLKHKQKKRKGKPKKRSMVDICAEAKSCTLEDLDRINGSNWAIDPSVMPYGNGWGSITTEKFVDEGNGSMINVDRDRGPNIVEVLWKKKHPIDYNAGGHNLLGKKRRVTKIKLNLSKSKSWNRKMISLRTDEHKIPEISIARPQMYGSATTEEEFESALQGLTRENHEGSCDQHSKHRTCRVKRSGILEMELITTDTQSFKGHVIDSPKRHLPLTNDRNSKFKRIKTTRIRKKETTSPKDIISSPLIV